MNEAIKEEQVKVKEVKKPKKNKSNQEIEKIKEENKTLHERVLRLNAEIQNMSRRYEETISKLRKYDGEEFAKEILPVLDNFERAIKLDDNDLTDELSKFLSGFKMIYTNFVNVLNAKEVKEIECLGKEFDPNFMEAVLTSKEEGIPKDQVMEVLQKGYKYKLLRAAMVRVSE